MDAELCGTLVLVDGFLRVEWPDGTSDLPLWPPGFKVCTDKDGTIQVRNKSGQVVAEVGKEVYMGGGGGGMSAVVLTEILQKPLPPSAKGPYWIVGDGVRLKDFENSKLFALDFVPAEDGDVFFIRRKPLLNSWVADELLANSWNSWMQKKTLVTGEVKIVNGSIRIVPGEDRVAPLPLWPSEYRASSENGIVTIMDETGRKAFRVGDQVVIEGHMTTQDWHYIGYTHLRKLVDELPCQCGGPYLMVSDIVTALDISGSGEQLPTGDQELRMGTAEAYASALGVSVDEALRRLKLQDPIEELGAALESQETDTFAGLWVQHEPDYRVIVMFTHNGEETLNRYIQDGPLSGQPDLFEVRMASITLTEIAEVQSETMRICEELGIETNSAEDLENNGVELYVTNKTQLDEALQKTGIRLPDRVRVTEVNELSQDD